jgi:hypothetical protein
MKRSGLSLLLLVVQGCTQCTPADRRTLEASTAGPIPPAEARRTYWPLDHEVAQWDTLLPGPDRYRVGVLTSCLNDSAVVNPITEDAGPALDVSHNYQSELTISHGRLPWAKATLTKALFRDQPVVQRLSPLHQLALSRTTFVRYRAGEFVFATRLGIPDSDLFVEAEVGFLPANGLHVIRVVKPTPDSSSE